MELAADGRLLRHFIEKAQIALRHLGRKTNVKGIFGKVLG